MSRIYYLFRHGETLPSKEKVPYGDSELIASILPESIPVIIKLGKYLGTSGIEYAARSEFLRCKETAQIVEKETDLKFVVDQLLNEFTERDFDTFEKRMRKLTAKLKSLQYERVALCTHGAVVAALRKLLLGDDFRAHDLMYYPKTGVILKIEGENITQIDFNL